MVPRHAMIWIDVNDPLDEAITEMLASGHSRFPLCDGSIDEVIGFVHVKDILEMQRTGGTDLRTLAREPLYVSESIPALRMIELFRSSGIHMAMVVDEYGSLEGLVMPTDILTGIAGDLPDQGDDDAPGAVEREDGSWLLDGSLPVEAAGRVLGVEDMRPDDYATLAGMIIEELGHIPTPGETSPCTAGASRWSTSTAAASTRCWPAGRARTPTPWSERRPATAGRPPRRCARAGRPGRRTPGSRRPGAAPPRRSRR